MASGWFGNFLSDGGWVGPALMAGATLYVGQQAAAANVQAAQIAQQTANRQLAMQAQQNALADQRFQQTSAMLEEQKAQAAPSVAKLQQTAASDPNMLTPEQEQQVADTRRTALSALQVSGLRGSGRATVATVRRTEDDTKNRLISQNQGRVDAANNALSSQYFNTTGQQVGAATNQNVVGQQGAATQAGIVGQQGATEANSLLANTSLYGRAVGDVAAVTADALKEGRRSYYRDNRPGESENSPSMGSAG
jgi:hypothetical protein